MSWLSSAASYLGLGWVGASISIVSLIAAVVMYFKTRQRADLSWAYRGEHLLGASSEGLPAQITMHYRGKPIPRLTKSLLVFWNSGEKTINDTDIVKADPFRLAVGDDGEILSISLLRPSRDVNEISITRSAIHLNQAFVTFSFLDASDGAVIEILHTSKGRVPELLGTLRGLPKGIKNLGKIGVNAPQGVPSFLPIRVFVWISTIIGLVAVLFSLLVPIDDMPFFKVLSGMRPSTSTFIAGLLYATPGAIWIFLTRRKYPRELHVDELD